METNIIFIYVLELIFPIHIFTYSQMVKIDVIRLYSGVLYVKLTFTLYTQIHNRMAAYPFHPQRNMLGHWKVPHANSCRMFF